MKKEKSAGAVVFIIEKNEPQYLLLKHNPHQGNHWAFPKGHTEQGETDEQTALREIKEETGLQDIKIHPNFKEKIKYHFTQEKKTITKEVTLFLAETKTKQVTISNEHATFEWLKYEDAHKQINYKDSKQILTKAHERITQKRQA